ncbi:MAG TPA: STAS domain-containing protein [Terriglobales bacterium]|nr:STAS domain-containing protein [Terriglobales bacterium]
MDLKINTREVGDVMVVDISGRITLGEETSALRKTIRDLISDGKKKIVLNLAEVSYIDSSGVGELVSGYTAARHEGGELKLLNLTKKVHDLLQVTKLYTIFDIKDNEFMAVKSFDWFFAK